MAIKVKAEIKIVPEKPELLDKVFEQIEDLPEGKYKIYVLDEKPNRSLQQNRYYWGVIVKSLTDHTGIDQEVMHKIINSQFNPEKFENDNDPAKILWDKANAQNGTNIPMPGSTKKLDTEQYVKFIEKIRLWALEELGCYIPLPQEIIDADYSEIYIQAFDMKL